MKRAIVTPPVLPASALAELKQWLAITTAHDDVPLTILLKAALETCEAFTGLMPLVTECEETVSAGAMFARGWQALSARPVCSVTSTESIDNNGTRTALGQGAVDIDIDADGIGRIRLNTTGSGRVAVRYLAGLADDWDSLPDGLRHGIVRLAAHQHREREADGAAGATCCCNSVMAPLAQIAADMIRAVVQTSSQALVTALAQQASTLAKAHAQTVRLSRTDKALRWRQADLLWPRFTKG